VNVASVKQGYKIEGYPLSPAQFSTLKNAGDVEFKALTAGELWENCSCGKEPVCVSCQKCATHCKCGASYWSISPAGISKAMDDFGLEIFVDGIKLEKAETIETSLANAKAKADEEIEKHRATAEVKANEEAEKRLRMKSWETGKIVLKIPESLIAYKAIESLKDGYSTSTLIQFISPKELEGMEGVKCEYEGYEHEEYISFLAPEETASILNLPYISKEFTKFKVHLLENPNDSDAANALAGLGYKGFEMNIRESSKDLEKMAKSYFSEPSNCQMVIDRWIEVKTIFAATGEFRIGGSYQTRSLSGTFFKKDWKGDKYPEETIAEALGIVEELESLWEASKPLIEAKLQGEKDLKLAETKKREEDRKQKEKQRLDEEKVRKEAIKAKATEIAEGIKGTKSALLDQYADLVKSGIICKSWSKDEIITAIATREAEKQMKNVI
jgi:hypothetical protein